jgi:hypothetical protein
MGSLAAIFLGMSKTGFTGVSLLGIALMAQIFPPRESTGVILPLLVFADVVCGYYFQPSCSVVRGVAYTSPRRVWSCNRFCYFSTHSVEALRPSDRMDDFLFSGLALLAATSNQPRSKEIPKSRRKRYRYGSPI